MAKARGNRAPFARSTAHSDRRAGGSTNAAHTPLSIRTSGVKIDQDVRDSARTRMGAKLGKFAERIERVTVRFADENGPRGGVDTTCRVKVVLSGLDSVVFESHARDPGEALNLAVSGIERAVRRTVARASGGTRASSSARGKAPSVARPAARPTKPTTKPASKKKGSLIGRRVGQGSENLARALDRPSKRCGDDPVDTSMPDTSATDRRAGNGSTARRNTHRATSAATSALEDSALDRPSRKSTRKSANRSKPASSLQHRETVRTTAPSARAKRSNAGAR